MGPEADDSACVSRDNVGCPAADQRGEPRPADGDDTGPIVCDIGAYEVGGTTFAESTPTGTNVMVEPLPPDGTTDTPVVVTFSAVSEGGYTNLVETATGPANPGFKLGNPPLFFDVDTSAGFTPPVTVCIDYSTVTFTNENNLKLFHYEDGAWVNSTEEQGSESTFQSRAKAPPSSALRAPSPRGAGRRKIRT